jgi:hypothetical protein
MVVTTIFHFNCKYVTSATDTADTLHSVKYCAKRFATVQYSIKEKRFRSPEHTTAITDTVGRMLSLQQYYRY